MSVSKTNLASIPKNIFKNYRIQQFLFYPKGNCILIIVSKNDRLSICKYDIINNNYSKIIKFPIKTEDNCWSVLKPEHDELYTFYIKTSKMSLCILNLENNQFQIKKNINKQLEPCIVKGLFYLQYPKNEIIIYLSSKPYGYATFFKYTEHEKVTKTIDKYRLPLSDNVIYSKTLNKLFLVGGTEWLHNID